MSQGHLQLTHSQYAQLVLFRRAVAIFECETDEPLKNRLKNCVWPSPLASENKDNLEDWLFHVKKIFGISMKPWVQDGEVWDTFVIIQTFSAYMDKLGLGDEVQRMLTTATKTAWYRNYSAHPGGKNLNVRAVKDALNDMHKIAKHV